MFFEILIFVLIFLLALQFFTQRRSANFPPGPIGIPILGNLLSLKIPIHENFRDLSKKYGNIFSIYFANYPVVVISDLKSIKDAFKDEVFSGRPSLRPILERSWGQKRGILFGEGKDWQEQRRFALKNLRDFGFGKGTTMETLINDEVVDLISEFKKELNQPVNLKRRFNAAVLNSLWHMIAGERFAHDDPQMISLISVISDELANQQVGGPTFFMPWLTKLFPKLTGWDSFIGSIKPIHAFLQGHVDAHRKTYDSNNIRDLIDVYLREIETTTDENSRFHKNEEDKSLLTVLLDLFAAGSETTSTTLNWAILYLINYPEVQQKLHDEIDNVIGSGKLAALSERPKMTYMEAFIAETLRKSSIVPIGIFHSCTETTTFQDYVLPKDTIVVGNIWQAHHNEEVWEKPEEFRPERFIDETGHFSKEATNGLIAFSTGKRVCIGESMARDSLFLFLTGLLQHFKFEAEKDVPLPTLVPHYSLTLSPQPFHVIMTERSEA
jgi:cytochrome P450